VGNRSRYVVAGSAAAVAAAVARARRRARLRSAALGATEAVMPSMVDRWPDEARPDDLHAPGHQHVAPPV